jgi:hypothetical protein
VCPNAGLDACRSQPRHRGAYTTDSAEIQAKATIAAALIASRAVDVASILSGSGWAHDGASVRLRELTDHVYQMITETKSDPTQSLCIVAGMAGDRVI